MSKIDITHIFVTIQEEVRRLSDVLRNKLFPGQIFFAFNLLLIFGIGGILYLLRLNTDSYSPVNASFFSILFVSLPWIATLFIFGCLVVCTGARPELQKVSTIFLVVAFLEIVGAIFMTRHVFTTSPRDRASEEGQKISQIVKDDRKDLPKKMNEYITQTAELSKGSFIMMLYEIKAPPNVIWDEDQMRRDITQQTCGYFSDPNRYGVVHHFVHIFMVENVRKYSFLVNKTDCVTP